MKSSPQAREVVKMYQVHLQVIINIS